MKSIFYALSVLAIGAAGFFGWTAKENFESQLEDRDALKTQNVNLSKNITEKTSDKEVATEARKVALDEEATTKASLESAIANERELNNTLDDIKNSLEEVVAEEAQIDEAIDAVKKLFPGIELDQVQSKYNEMVDQEKKLTAQLEDLELFKVKLGEDIAKNKADIVRVKKKVADSIERVRNNTFQATVTAVDSEWDFVVIGAGEKSGLTAESKLLVQREGRLLGKLSVYKVEANRAIADIEPGSLSPGVVLRRGDQVILEKVRSN
jgi:DNA repair exonuclease SbcCD ATPase subunit